MIRSQVVSIGFGFRTHDEVRRLSAKEITNPHAFDALEQPVPGGLYDPHLGPLNQSDVCVTCGLTQIECLGHVGHIELCVPLFQPLLFKHTLSLMGLLCFKCHYLRANRYKVRLMVCCPRLLAAGLLEDAIECSKLKKLKIIKTKAPKKASKKAKAAIEVDDDEDMDEVDDDDEDDDMSGQEANGPAVGMGAMDVEAEIDMYFAKAKKAKEMQHSPQRPTQNVAAFRKNLVREFLGKMRSSRKCQNCRYICPTVTRDGFSKMFEKSLSERDEKALVSPRSHTTRQIWR